jgi:cell wall-associated NlpC family hydrolase
MAPQAGISGRAVALATAGGVLIYAGLRGESPLEALRGILTGSPPPLPEGKGISLTDFGSGTIPGAADVGAGPNARLASAAARYLGVPYRWGGTSRAGLDCSGLVVVSYRDIGVTGVPRTSLGQRMWGNHTQVSASQAAAGDLVYWPGHIGIVVAKGRMINAPRTGRNVEYASIGSRNGVAPTYLRYAPKRRSGRAI